MTAATAPAKRAALAAPILFPRGPAPWLVPGIATGAAVPVLAIGLGFARRTLGANPVSEALNELGLLALIALVASLACTPLKIVTGWTWPIRVRKTLGLMAFAYACLHFVVYVGLDQLLDVKALLADVWKRPFIAVGLLAFLLLIPLAVTSTASMLKRLGAARWRRLHKLAYVAASLGTLHFFLRVKKDVTAPVAYAVILGVLFAARAVAFARAKR